ncbi:MAG: 5-formyltetrahydrofolate cyclo-ligase [Fusobacteria bacterium]|nr:5-formyltetrahydrofolate cyclo-ligase [Fusobacteriota bacterium]
MDKSSARKLGNVCRSSITKEAFEYSKVKIFENFKALNMRQNYIASFISIQTEISTHLLNEWIFSEKNLILPKVKGSNLLFYQIKSLDEGFEKGRFDLVEPQESIHTKIQVSEIEVVLFPGMAFTQSGKRVGYGKGYYDKALAEFKGIKIGICFENQIVDEIFTESYDISMNYIITEKNVYKCKKD